MPQSHNRGPEQSRLPAAFDAILPFLQDADINVRCQAAWGLVYLGDARASAPLAAALADPNPAVTNAARTFFGFPAQPGMVDALVDAYARTSDVAHRAEIIRALVSVRDGKHRGYGTTPPADLIAQLRADASAALDKIQANGNAKSAEAAAFQPLPLDSTGSH